MAVYGVLRDNTGFTFEVVAAAALLRKYAPALRVRIMNVTDLIIRAVHMNFHGYPIELKGLLFGRPNLERVTLEGYLEEGTTHRFARTRPYLGHNSCIWRRRTTNTFTSKEKVHRQSITQEQRHAGETRGGTSADACL